MGVEGEGDCGVLINRRHHGPGRRVLCDVAKIVADELFVRNAQARAVWRVHARWRRFNGTKRRNWRVDVDAVASSNACVAVRVASQRCDMTAACRYFLAQPCLVTAGRNIVVGVYVGAGLPASACGALVA